VTALFQVANSTSARDDPSLSEVDLLHEKGVPAAALDVDAIRYFWYHHTQADTMDAVDSDEVDLCVATMASAAFVYADIADRVPSNMPPTPALSSTTQTGGNKSPAAALHPSLGLLLVGIAAAGRIRA